MRNPAVYRDICGTENGYRHHSKRTEATCQPCRTAWNNRCKQYLPEPPPKIAEIIHEVEWMLSLNQGTHYILTAIGYEGREKSLQARLQKHGRLDLYHRVISGEYTAAAA